MCKFSLKAIILSLFHDFISVINAVFSVIQPLEGSAHENLFSPAIFLLI